MINLLKGFIKKFGLLLLPFLLLSSGLVMANDEVKTKDSFFVSKSNILIHRFIGSVLRN